MEGFSLTEQSEQEASVEIVQKSVKKRSLEDKVGKLKLNNILLKRLLDEAKLLRKELEAEKKAHREDFKELLALQRLILNGFRGYGLLKYTPPMLEKYACEDAVDLAIVDAVFRAGAPGILPKTVASDASLKVYGLRHYHVSRRIVRMNKRLFEKMRECLFEKRGHRWALTSFAFEAWGKSGEEDEVEREVNAE
jgi:hypothetical protein